MAYRFLTILALTLIAPPMARAQNEGFEAKIAEIKANTPLSVWRSKQISTDNKGDVQRLLLGTTSDTFFCALSSSNFYRHGNPNRGSLECNVYVEGANWYISANGPTDSGTRGTQSGLAKAACSAICLK